MRGKREIRAKIEKIQAKKAKLVPRWEYETEVAIFKGMIKGLKWAMEE